ncbi:MAG: secondary thiamine-phosphate synthase enzyme YjbQ [Clostridia bacterium]|nr:secondary thiamine-phosphate synthase enzyme YjbQ [Clostridia bacterium]
MMYTLNVKTQSRTSMIDITSKVQQVVKESGIKSGVCTVFVPHTTAGITINENADPDVVSDMLKEINKIVPFDDNYAHMEGNSAAHIKASMFGFSLQVIIENSELQLGTWQGIYFCEFDGPRSRKVYVKITG